MTLSDEQIIADESTTPITGRLNGTVSPSDEHRRLRVLLVDDEDVVHWGFRMLLSGETWVERFHAAHTANAALLLATRYEPHVALVDLMLGGESGADLCERIRAESPPTRVLLMSGVERMSAQSARAVGASGFVPKGWGARDIAGAARMVGLGMTVFTSEGQHPPNLLTEREREVLGMIAGGATNREIAERLFLSPHTVKDHTSTLYKKMKARNRAEAIVRAQRMGLLA
jgi:DNA-binding NarL/FixJ family response regulator